MEEKNKIATSFHFLYLQCGTLLKLLNCLILSKDMSLTICFEQHCNRGSNYINGVAITITYSIPKVTITWA